MAGTAVIHFKNRMPACPSDRQLSACMPAPPPKRCLQNVIALAPDAILDQHFRNLACLHVECISACTSASMIKSKMSTASYQAAHWPCGGVGLGKDYLARKPLHRCHGASLRHEALQMPSHRPRLESYSRRLTATCFASSISAESRSNKIRLIQHKEEAFWFYRFLSIVYDTVVNPGHWTEDMRTDALSVAQLDDANLKVCDVGGGTGFCTLGIVKTINPANVTLVDQSPHQLAKAKAKPALQTVTIKEGDAEDLPLPTDGFDRYVSAGSIEYWPDPQRGIREAYRVLKSGGLACLIGPVHPTFWLSRFFADVWMLFPTEAEYKEWFTKAGFEDVQIKRIGPKWYRGVRRHGLIMGCSVTGRKAKAGDSPLQLPAKPAETTGKRRSNPFLFVLRLLLGSAAGFYYFVLPIYMWIKDKVWPKGLAGF